MTVAAPPAAMTVLDTLVLALERAGSYNSSDQTAPAAVLWTDESRHWEPLLPLLLDRLPALTLGPYNPNTRSGPAYWIRCVVDRTLPQEWLPGDAVPVIYLPGISRSQLRAVEDCPDELQPLAELQYRGVFWSHKNGRDWTPAAFLSSQDVGPGVEVAGDNASRQALSRALVRLAAEPVSRLKAAAPIRADFLDSILNPDEVRSILLWMNDPEGYNRQQNPAERSAFRNVCDRKYGFDPEKDTPITAASLLGQRDGAWEVIWMRFAEAPRAYPNLPDLLRHGRPQTALPLFHHAESWPQENETAEDDLRQRLQELGDKLESDARATVKKLETEHGARRGWVWAQLGMSPLATALEHLGRLAILSARTLPATSVPEIATAYTEWGWQVDAAALEALAAVEQAQDVSCVKAAVRALYHPWLERAALVMQDAVVAGPASETYPRKPMATIPTGTSMLFTDALRYDVGQALAASLRESGYRCETEWQLAALPSVTPTAKPAVSPVAIQFSGEGMTGLEPSLADTGSKVTIQVLRKALENAGYQILRGDETSGPAGRAWTEAGQIDSYGHEHGWEIARHIPGEVRALRSRIDALLQAGWQKVVVVTDHGWLLLPGGLPKAELPEHLTEVRKGRCARLKEGSATQEQTVPWHWDPRVRIALARGIHVYGAGKEYEHGGVSPQECIVPVLTVTAAPTGVSTAEIEKVTWRGLRARVQVIGTIGHATVDIRTKPGDPSTSVVSEPRAVGQDGQAALVVVDDDLDGSTAMLVVLDEAGRPQAQLATVIGLSE